MKRLLSTAVMMLLFICGCSSEKTELYNAGIYSGTGEGMNGDVVVDVEVNDTEIIDITIRENTETKGVSTPAIEQIPVAIVEEQTADVDTVSGATYTSKAIIAAVKDALAKADK